MAAILLVEFEGYRGTIKNQLDYLNTNRYGEFNMYRIADNMFVITGSKSDILNLEQDYERKKTGFDHRILNQVYPVAH